MNCFGLDCIEGQINSSLLLICQNSSRRVEDADKILLNRGSEVESDDLADQELSVKPAMGSTSATQALYDLAKLITHFCTSSTQVFKYSAFDFGTHSCNHDFPVTTRLSKFCSRKPMLVVFCVWDDAISPYYDVIITPYHHIN
ncbi:hypothetical protein PGT21_029074 [Puccinia graminis f. sp. tritici]|uniref:Uncharacterized protein n=1 Tax=Puccinia graminis f. sp. tritici TaxID=56615 RepID=A0A5B0NZR0_PUCGR|nr:hypothetical protein PGT21_029032 [Puccinia graminis f. sp. tritici]KAA1093229.1 hypothetical protein PGT21_029074 [Puccinia graminis f. sp. tritici]